MDTQSARTGAPLVLVATIGLSFKGIWARLAYVEGLTVSGVMFYRSLLALPVVVGVVLWLWWRSASATPVNHEPEWRRAVVHSALLGGAFAFGMYCDFQAIALLGAGVSRVILFGFPLVVMVMDSLARQAWPSRHRVVGFAVAWIGLFLVAQGPAAQEGPEARQLGLLWAFGSLLMYATYVWFSGKLSRTVGALRFTMVSQLATGVVVLSSLLISTGGEAPDVSSTALGWMLAMVCISTIVPYFLITEGIRRMGAARASLLSMFGPVVTLVAGALVLGEVLSVTQWLGGGATLVGVKLSQRS